MDFKLSSYCLHILIFVCVIEANITSSDDEIQQPRGRGRVVKLYSGPRPDPIVCTDEGFKGDPKNCAVFYRCMKSGRGKYTAFKFQCPHGTVYDPDTEVCNHPRNTKRSECGGFVEPPLSHYGVNEIEQLNELPSPISTKAPLLSTLTTKKTSVVPDSNSLFSQQLTSNKLQITTSSIHPTSASTKYQELMSHPWSSTTQTYSPFILPVKPSVNQQHNELEDICTYDGFMGDSVNCHKFYRCVGNPHSGFTKYEFSCSEPTIWDDDLKSCNHPWAVKRSRCGRTLIDDKSSTKSTIIPLTTTVKTISNGSKTIQSQLQIAYGNNVRQTQTQISNNAVIQNQTQIAYGERVNKTTNTRNKQNQTQTSHGSAVSQSQYQLGHGNEVVQTQVQIDHSKQSSQSQVQIVETTKMPSTSSTPEQHVTKTPTDQSNLCSESGFMGDSNDCKKFYRCVDNGRGGFNRHEFSCGEGTSWDQSIEACNHAWAVKECGGKTAAVSQKTTTKQTLSTSTQKYSTTPKPIEHFMPSTEVPNTSDFEDVGYNNNQASLSSLEPTQSTTETLGIGTECKSSGFIGDAANCQIFYSCVANGNGGYKKYEFKCSDGTLWDADIGGCNHAWAVKRCGGNSTPTNLEITASTTPKQTIVHTNSPDFHVTTQNDDYDSGYGEHKEQPSSTTTINTTNLPQDNLGNANNDCQSTGFMGDNTDCKKFYRCVNNGDGSYTRYEFTCGEGTLWDSQIEGCNHAWAVVNCNNTGPNKGIEATTQKKPTTIHEEMDIGYNIPEEKDPDIITQKTTVSTTTLKTTDSLEQNTCSKTGFIGDTTDCKKFYRCVDNGDGSFTRYEFTCGQGTVWDQKIEACNHAWAVEKCGAYLDTDHGEATTSAYNVSVSYEEPIHGYPTPEYPVQNEEVTHKTTLKQSTASVTTPLLPSAYCTKDGFIGDKRDCKKFYRCVNDGKGGFIRHEFQCGEGTVWDQSIEACNHAWAVKDCGARNDTMPNKDESTTEMVSSSVHSTDKTSSTTNVNPENEISEDCKAEGFMGDSKDCKMFYRCVDNGQGGFIKYEFKCGEGTYWNQINQACDHASPDHPCKDSENNIVTNKPQHITDETNIETTTKITTVLATETQGNLSFTEKPPSSGTNCKSDGFFGDQNNCQKFYRCVDDGRGSYIKYDFTCGDGTVWNQELQTCGHESKSNTCSSTSTTVSSSSQSHKPPKESGDSSVPTSTQMQHVTSTETIGAQQTSTEHTSGEYRCTAEGFHANPADCRKFIRCVSDSKGTFTQYDFACGDGTIWVQEILACDHDDGTASCQGQNEWTSRPLIDMETSTLPDPMSSSTTVQSVNTTKHEDEYNTETTKIPQIPNDDCKSEGFYADKSDCKKYYRCVPNNDNGYTKYEFVCSEGTAWDTNTHTCNHNSVVHNCQGSSQIENQTEIVVHDEISDSPESSSSSTTQASTTESMEATSLANEDNCEKEGFFGNTKDCKKFYRCVGNGNGGLTKYDFTCGEGTIWDQDLLTCNHPHDVVHPSCKQSTGGTSENTTESPEISTSKSTPSTATTTSSSTTQSSQTPSTSTENSVNCTEQEPPKNSGNKNVTCTKAGYYADPSDCKKFYRCVDWDGNGEKFSVYFFECGEGTIWDPALDTCNHEESVYPPRDCSNSQSQNNSSGQESTTTEQSTSQQSTTTEKSSTEATTSENTTPQSTTSEQTTTQQSTTSEKTTTVQSTSSELTTTQQSTSTETTTTEHLTTTSEGTTTQAENTTEITTEQPTTTEGVKETTTTEQSTTQESSTTSSTTIAESSTTESTTQQTMTESETESTDTTEQTQFTTTTETTQQTSTTDSQQETTTEQSSSSSSCPETDDDQYLFVCPTSFRRHPKYCNLFYQCTEDDDSHEVKVAVFNCPNNTIYDENKVQCVEEDKADHECEGEIAARRRVKRLGGYYKEPIIVTKDTHKCTTSGHMPFEKNSDCSPAFLKCKRTKSGTLRGYVYRCPQNYVYWSKSRRCEREEAIMDCKRTINNWSGRWEIPIDRQNVAW